MSQGILVKPNKQVQTKLALSQLRSERGKDYLPLEKLFCIQIISHLLYLQFIISHFIFPDIDFLQPKDLSDDFFCQ